MKNLYLNSLLARLRPPRPRRRLRPSGLDAQAPAPRRAQIILLSRELCRFTSFAVPLASNRRQVAAIRLQIEQISPFARTGIYAIVSGVRVTAWFWDEARACAQVGDAGIDPEAAEFWPESVLMPPTDGARLFKTADGYEGRIEERGAVVGSRWWREEPSLEEWREFCRDRGVRAGVDLRNRSLPQVEPIDDAFDPFAPNIARRSRLSQPALLERGAYVAMVLFLLAPGMFLLGEWLRIRQDFGEQDRQLATLKSSAAPILEQRQIAIDAAEFIEGLNAALPARSPIEVIATIAKALPEGDVYFGDVDVRPTTLKAQIFSGSKALSAAELLAELEKSEIFQNVQIAGDSFTKSLNLTAELVASQKAEGARSE